MSDKSDALSVSARSVLSAPVAVSKPLVVLGLFGLAIAMVQSSRLGMSDMLALPGLLVALSLPVLLGLLGKSVGFGLSVRLVPLSVFVWSVQSVKCVGSARFA